MELRIMFAPPGSQGQAIRLTPLQRHRSALWAKPDRSGGRRPLQQGGFAIPPGPPRPPRGQIQPLKTTVCLLTSETEILIIKHGHPGGPHHRWSHAHGNLVVPSPWLMTAVGLAACGEDGGDDGLASGHHCPVLSP
jgi:hypothetical protein